MPPSELLRDYGYLAIMVGTFFEGELIMLAAGIAAAAGVLSVPGVIGAGMAGVFASDSVCFFLGRFCGTQLGRWFPGLFARLERVFQLMERYDHKLIIGYQFFPGLCTITPMAFGMTRISAGRFLALDAVGNAGWTLAFTFGGYFCGEAVLRFAKGFDRLTLIATGVIVLGAAWYAYRHWRPKLNTRWSASSSGKPVDQPAKSFGQAPASCQPARGSTSAMTVAGSVTSS
jgi:membrane protein DedA with SNARE-associated domain